MLVKLSSQQIEILGLKSPADFDASFEKFHAEHSTATKFMAENSTSIAALTTRIETLEKSGFITEARAKEIVSADGPVAVKAYVASEEGKKAIGAEASRITQEAMAAIGTSPVKPSPAPAGTGNDQTKGLIAGGKFEEAYAQSKELQDEFPSAKHFAVYAKAEAEGRVSFAKSPASDRN